MDRNLIIDINNGYLLKKKYIKHKHIPTTIKLNLLEIFLKIGIISGYKILGTSRSKKHLVIFLKYDNKGNKIFKNLKIVPQKQRNYTVVRLKKHLLKNKFNQLILCTNLGLITSTEAIKYNIGGKPLYILNY